MPELDNKYNKIYSAFLFLRSCKKHDDPISILDLNEYLKNSDFEREYFFSVIKHLDSINV